MHLLYTIFFEITTICFILRTHKISLVIIYMLFLVLQQLILSITQKILEFLNKSNNQFFKHTLPFIIYSKMTKLQKFQPQNAIPQSHSIVQKDYHGINYKLTYSNKNYFKPIPNPSSKPSQIGITNTIFQKQDDQFKKVTEIQIGNKIIVVQDIYKFNDYPIEQQFNYKSSQVDTYNNMQMVSQVPSQKQVNKPSEEEWYRRKDKKNIVKSVIKSFMGWLKSQYQKSNESQLYILQSMKEIQKLLKQMKFNNQLILTIINNKILANIFQYFLSNQAMKRIEQSKIKDKESYSEAIKMYAKACTTKNVECLQILKNNNIKSI